MRLAMPGLEAAPRTELGGVAGYALVPGARLELYPLVPLPVDVAGWVRDIAAAGGARVTDVIEKHTELGWPVTLAASELADPATGAVVELRLHALYRFLEYGGIAIVRSAEIDAFTRAMEIVRPLLPQVRPDFAGDGVPALALVWAGL